MITLQIITLLILVIYLFGCFLVFIMLLVDFFKPSKGGNPYTNHNNIPTKKYLKSAFIIIRYSWIGVIFLQNEMEKIIKKKQ